MWDMRWGLKVAGCELRVIFACKLAGWQADKPFNVRYWMLDIIVND